MFQGMLGKPEKGQWHKCGKAEAKRKKNLERFRGTLGKPGKVLRQVRETWETSDSCRVNTEMFRDM
jgi:hypothetical protein